MSAVLDQLWRVRDMQRGDLRAVLDIEHLSYDFPWSQGIFEDCLRMDYCCQVLSEGDQLLRGYGLMSAAVGEAHLLNLCIAPDCRRSGMARYLLTQLLYEARAREAYVMYLEVRPSNRAALALYSDMGFTRVGLRRRYYPALDGREDAIVLSRDID